MDLTAITPLVLTYNEEANIGRTLGRLPWAERVVVVDSYSTEATIDIATSYDNVDLVQREFDHFADQCNYGLEQIDTEWVLSLDADYVCSEALIDEMRALPAIPTPTGSPSSLSTACSGSRFGARSTRPVPCCTDGRTPSTTGTGTGIGYASTEPSAN